MDRPCKQSTKAAGVEQAKQEEEDEDKDSFRTNVCEGRPRDAGHQRPTKLGGGRPVTGRRDWQWQWQWFGKDLAW
ncbi:hypothetical protein V493_01835 [Pseudogymnoascus sp. VKM F-4281 (FW-2241)]|nr:hypothetical protein V493_01835 [Pseudogymnoascus sp. VKM F-4281 (FW-2241)]